MIQIAKQSHADLLSSGRPYETQVMLNPQEAAKGNFVIFVLAYTDDGAWTAMDPNMFTPMTSMISAQSAKEESSILQSVT